MADPLYTCCEDGMLSQVQPTDHSGLCPACKPATTEQPLLTDDDWQAIADESDRIVPSVLKQAVERRLHMKAERADPTMGWCGTRQQAHAIFGPLADYNELNEAAEAAYGRFVLPDADGVAVPVARHCQSGNGDVCRASQRDGIVCPPESCDIDDGTRPPDGVMASDGSQQ